MDYETKILLNELIEAIQNPSTDCWMFGITCFSAIATLCVAYMSYRVVKNQAKMQRQEQVKDIYIHTFKMLNFISRIDSNILRCCSIDNGFKFVYKEYDNIYFNSSYTLDQASVLLNNDVYKELSDLAVSFEVSLSTFSYLEAMENRPIITNDETYIASNNGNKAIKKLVYDKFSNNIKLLHMANNAEEIRKKHDKLLNKIIN